MKFLLDTNEIIPAEPTSEADVEKGTAEISSLLGLLAKMKFEAYIHPASKKELGKDRNQTRREIRLRLLSKYQSLPSPPPLTEEITAIIGLSQPGSNDEVDAQLLAAVAGNAVHVLVSNDLGLHRRAKRLGASDRVLSVSDALQMLTGLLPEEMSPPPAVEQIHCHQLNPADAFFDSLRADYPRFDDWLKRCQLEHRHAFRIRQDGKLAGLVILNQERRTSIGMEGKVLKICTFKVSNEFRGLRLGELLLRAVFRYVAANNYDVAFLTCFPKQSELMLFLEQFGFSKNETTSAGEIVYIKKFQRGVSDIQSDALEYFVRFGPGSIALNHVSKYMVPILPEYHRLLFPDLEQQRSMFAGSDACGNSILKAYLCRSNRREIEPGSVIFFYKSHGGGHVRAVGVVDRTIRSSSPEEIARYVGKRTVYSLSQIQVLCEREVLVVLFRYAFNASSFRLQDFITHGALTSHPQSITKLKPEADEWIRTQLDEILR